MDLSTSKLGQMRKSCNERQTHSSFLEFKCGIYSLWKSLFQECFQIFPFQSVARKSLLGEIPLSWRRGRDPSYPLLHKACDGSWSLWHDTSAVPIFMNNVNSWLKTKLWVRYEICLGKSLCVRISLGIRPDVENIRRLKDSPTSHFLRTPPLQSLSLVSTD